MRVVCAPDSFKGSLSAVDAARAMAAGVREADPTATCVEVPMSDGGEGFVDAIAAALDASRHEVVVSNQAGDPVRAGFALEHGEAFIDVASAIGLDLVPTSDRRVGTATSHGVGQLLRAALDAGAHRLVIGLGGSGTNDAGAGMLEALGAVFIDEDGRRVPAVPDRFLDIASLDLSGMDARLERADVVIASDVTNPLVGPAGASHVFGPQKGATAAQVDHLDRALGHLAACARRTTGGDHSEDPGAGAAGGLGYAFLEFLHARVRPGVQVVADAVDLAGKIRGASLVLTGEGGVDAQTLGGKTPLGVARIAADQDVPVILIAGTVADDADVLLGHGVTALLPTPRTAATLDELLPRAERDVRAAAASAVRIFQAGRRSTARLPRPVSTPPPTGEEITSPARTRRSTRSSPRRRA